MSITHFVSLCSDTRNALGPSSVDGNTVMTTLLDAWKEESCNV